MKSMILTDIVSSLKQKIGQFAYTSRLYNFSLDWGMLGQSHPELVMTPADPWPGQSPKGRWLCQGAFSFEQESIPLTGNYWAATGASKACMDHLHSFEWLRHLKSFGGETARRQSRDMIESWIDTHPNWAAQSWRPEILGGRIAIWLSLFEFYADNAPEALQSKILASIQRQAKHLSRSITTENLHGIPLLNAAKGLIYAGLAFHGRENILEQGLEIFEREIPQQVLSDGGHISRSPKHSLHILKLCCDVNAALAKAGYPRLTSLQHAMDKCTPAVRFFRHGDKKMCNFHQSGEYSDIDIDSVLAQIDGKIRIPRCLGHTGYDRATGGRSALIVDTGLPPVRPYDKTAHASPLAFEFSHGRERIFVNCGSHSTDPNWMALLRSSAAHNTLTLDDRNTFEIRADGHVGRRVGTIDVDRFDAEGGMIIDGRHTGYESATGLVHRRRLFLSNNGCDLRGEDTLEGELTPGKDVNVAIRFHLHPRVLVSLIQQGRECLLRTQCGHGWRFYHVGGELRLENSVYLGEAGQVRKTKQIVLYSTTDTAPVMVQWALQKENN